MTPDRSPRSWLVGVLALGALGALLWLGMSQPAEPDKASTSAPLPKARMRTRDDTRPVAEATPVSAVVPAARIAFHDPHPHPITDEHRRRYREADLLHGAWVAIKARAFAKARELADTHEREYPGQQEDMNLGLRLLADCVEHPSAETVARARAFYEGYTHSQMRRRIRRLCLEAPSG